MIGLIGGISADRGRALDCSGYHEFCLASKGVGDLRCNAIIGGLFQLANGNAVSYAPIVTRFD